MMSVRYVQYGATPCVVLDGFVNRPESLYFAHETGCCWNEFPANFRPLDQLSFFSLYNSCLLQVLEPQQIRYLNISDHYFSSKPKQKKWSTRSGDWSKDLKLAVNPSNGPVIQSYSRTSVGLLFEKIAIGFWMAPPTLEGENPFSRILF